MEAYFLYHLGLSSTEQYKPVQKQQFESKMCIRGNKLSLFITWQFCQQILATELQSLKTSSLQTKKQKKINIMVKIALYTVRLEKMLMRVLHRLFTLLKIMTGTGMGPAYEGVDEFK